MMSPQETFEVLAKQAKEELEALTEAIARKRATREQASRQLESLRGYQQDYAQMLQTEMTQGIVSAQCRTYQGFINALGGVISQQETSLAQIDLDITQHQTLWQKSYRKCQSLEALMNRQRQKQAVHARRLDQKLSDEQAARLSAKSRVIH